ncbi:3-hydroxybutyryl-CoA dehydrogenase [Kineosphaera limosa]|uniref:Putative 3-hydroxyacyl-CoA dehydrogenase n=1 Tax=Kineosphaera limosa NBRC 100340 TaxID=1184609 RepID=K6WSR5_9MICO|nr:3-hydroxybutyryl-CoA dehydrogenase [Kineosphaera limosa]NYE02961.1 3-hydroxybutyryl-CoA dehydrogenase [Kineosphaera limosa]GAB95147.1 putative 3-hydroxyacyl-CoA dehydrogenase [Kineosphaera limosa NBRC 100340]
MAREFTKVAVVGVGTVGAGIVETFARSGRDVVAVALDDEKAARGRDLIERSTQAAVDGGKMEAEARQALLGRVTITTAIEDVADADLVVEAVSETIEAKRRVVGQLEGIIGDDAVLATNTSSHSVTDIAASMQLPGRVIGLHFFPPVPVMRLVEVVRTVMTDPPVIEEMIELVTSLDKDPIVVEDRAGYIADALVLAYLNHAVSMFEANYASREDIDAAMKFGCGLPRGPLELLDLIGIDTAYSVLDTMHRQSGDPMQAPRPILKQMVTAGMLGRKSGRGFYTYDGPDSGKVVADTLTPTPPAAGGEGLRSIDKVGVVGNGTMAMGIVEVFVKAGYPVTFVARSQEKADGSLAKLAKSLDKGVARGKMTQEARDAALGLATPSASVDDLADVDIVVEAIAEDLDVKTDMFARLDAVCKPGAILATTTSSLPVIKCAMATSRPQDVIGMHFFNPAQVMRLVEVVSTLATADDVVATVADLCIKLRKHAVFCGDVSGFIVNALLFPYLNNAIKMLASQYATIEEIDMAMKVGCGYPMGPFELLDVVGLDVSSAILHELFAEFRQPGFAPAPLLEYLVQAGFMGRKTGRGFHNYAR